ncbi:recombinase family protein [Streptomyces sp. NPDC057757]|uniref:recombinase family protein n=1 Tax=Streptomyces sp. NPDC057757 TaxID=3346241 RepID=UPI0036867466
MAVHAGVYGRQSAERANKSEVSMVAQLAAGVNEARLRGADRITEYEDLGISAFKGDERPGFDRMIKDCHEGRINLIIVHYISRLSRMAPLDAMPVVTELLDLGVTIVSLTEGEFAKGSLLDVARLIQRLDAAHSESKNKSHAIRAAKTAAGQLGGYLGGKPPYGFRLVSATRKTPAGKSVVIQLLEHDPAEVTVIRHVWETVIENRNKPHKPGAGRRRPGSLTGICTQMTADGVPTKGQTVGKETKNSVWDLKTLMRILRDPRIAGYDAEPLYRRTEEGRTTSVLEGYRIKLTSGTGEPIMAYPPIVPTGEWHELQDWFDGRERTQGLSRGHAVLSAMGILYCECGAVMTSHRATTGNKSAYRCRRRRTSPGQHAGDCTVSQRTLDQHVVRSIVGLIQEAGSDAEAAAVLAEAARRYAAANEQPAVAVERRALLTERADVKRALEELREREAAGDRAGPGAGHGFRDRRARLLAVMDRAEARITELDEAARPSLPVHLWLTAGAPALDLVGEERWWASASTVEQRSFVKLFIERIVITKALGAGRTSPVEKRAKIQFVRPQGASD